MDLQHRVINVYNTYTIKDLLTDDLSGCQLQNVELILVSRCLPSCGNTEGFFFIVMKGEKYAELD